MMMYELNKLFRTFYICIYKFKVITLLVCCCKLVLLSHIVGWLFEVNVLAQDWQTKLCDLSTGHVTQYS